MRRVLFTNLVLLAVFFLALANVSAQESVSSDAADSSVEADKSSDDPSGAEEANESDESDASAQEAAAPEPEQPEVNPDASFTPTEEISEDRPVPFPVDI